MQELVAGWTGTLLGMRQGRDEVLQRIIDGAHNPETLAEATWLKSYLGEGPKASEAVRAQVAERFPDSTVALRHHAEAFRQQRLQVGMTAPDIVGVDTDGATFKLSDYRGKVVLLDFWGDW